MNMWFMSCFIEDNVVGVRYEEWSFPMGLMCSLHGWEAAVRSPKWSTTETVFRRRIQSSEQNLFDGEDEILVGAVGRRGRPELLAEPHVSFQSFVGCYHDFLSLPLFFHCLRTQPTNPPPTVPLPHAPNVRLRALLHQPAAAALHGRHRRLRRFRSHLRRRHRLCLFQNLRRHTYKPIKLN